MRSRLTPLLTTALPALAALALATPAAHAAEWNERTVMKFSAAVIVPGATLQPGSYVFQLANPQTSQHVVEIRREGDNEVVAITQAIPIKRTEPEGDIVVMFNPTEQGTPPALKGWFYPGSLYGHQFVYPEEEARQIAERTKTIVLSGDVEGSDFERGSLRTINPSGTGTEWHGDQATLREWDDWQRSRQSARAGQVEDPQSPRADSRAPAVNAEFQATRVELDELEENTQRYIGPAISVDAAVQDVLGPRLFTVDEPNWGDLDGEILVFMPTAFAAMVREDDRLTITGTMKPFVELDLDREWGWLGADPDVELEIDRKPVLVPTRLVGGNNDVALMIEAGQPGDRPVGTSGSAAAATRTSPITDAAKINDGDDSLVGRKVRLNNVVVDKMAKDRGFFLEPGVFVLTSAEKPSKVQEGDRVSIEGVVLQMPSGMADRLDEASQDDLYVYATDVRK